MIKLFEEFVNEAAYHVPLDGIMGKGGRALADRAFVIDEEDYVKYPRYEFVLPSAKNREDFEANTASREFWMAIYDYDGVMDNNNDYTAINANMKKFINVIFGKKLYIYCTNPENVGELKTRCENAKNTYNFTSVKFINV